MSHFFLITLMLFGLASFPPLRAQGWDASRKASGWAFQDVDGSLVFYDPATRELRSWLKGSGQLSALPVALPVIQQTSPTAPVPSLRKQKASDYEEAGALLYGLPRHSEPTSTRQAFNPTRPPQVAPAQIRPERWVVDTYGRTWMVGEGHLVVLGKEGKSELHLTLPAAVEDLGAGRDGVFILYRTPKPYLEKRHLRTGAVLWTYGDKDQLKEAATQSMLVPMNRMTLGADETLYLAEGASLAFTVLDPTKGPSHPGQTFFTYRETLPPRASLGRLGRGPILSWVGKDVIFGVFTPNQVKACGAPTSEGLILARFDLANSTLEWLPTALTEGHLLLGLLENEAVFLAPQGGLAYAAIH
ncbi:MAG TPA: hypothetical protein VJ549_08100 [Geothrix sp.]|nr:hypothetical protein [Geothrix sp.]